MTVSVVNLAALSKPSKEQENFAKNIQQHAFNGALVATVGITAGTVAFALSKQDTFINPSEIVYDPNLHFFNDLVKINRGVYQALVFGGGVFSTAASAAFSVGNSIYQAYRNYDFIQKSDQHLIDYIANIDLANILIANKDSQVVYLTPADVMAYSRKKCVNKITSDTITDGATGTVSLAASIFSLGLIIPVIFPITASLTLIALSLGTIVTGIATYFNRRALNAKLDASAKRIKVKLVTKSQVNKLNDIIKNTESNKYDEMVRNVYDERRISKTNKAILATTLFLRLSTIAKHLVEILGSIATGALSVLAYARSALDAVINYRQRQKFLAKIPMLVAQATLPWIDQKAYLFFGKTKLENYIKANKDILIKKYRHSIDFTQSPKKIIAQLSKTSDPKSLKILIELRKECTEQLMQKDFQKFCVANPGYGPDANRMLRKYLLNRVETLIAKDVKLSGRMNAAKVAFSTAFGFSIIFPPLAGLFAAVSVGMLLISEAVTQIVAFRESRKFRAATAKLIDQALDMKNPETNSDAYALNQFIGLIKPNLVYVKPGKTNSSVSRIIQLFPGTKLKLPQPKLPELAAKPSTKQVQAEVISYDFFKNYQNRKKQLRHQMARPTHEAMRKLALKP
jgi:hypothetical protein